MAHYDYCCTNTACNHTVTDLYQSIKSDPLTECPKCKQSTFERIISGGILVKIENVPSKIIS